MDLRVTALRRVTHAQARLEEARYWASRSMAERVLAGWALRDNDLLGPLRTGPTGTEETKHDPAQRPAWVLRRVEHGRR